MMSINAAPMARARASSALDPWQCGTAPQSRPMAAKRAPRCESSMGSFANGRAWRGLPAPGHRQQLLLSETTSNSQVLEVDSLTASTPLAIGVQRIELGIRCCNRGKSKNGIEAHLPSDRPHSSSLRSSGVEGTFARGGKWESSKKQRSTGRIERFAAGVCGLRNRARRQSPSVDVGLNQALFKTTREDFDLCMRIILDCGDCESKAPLQAFSAAARTDAVRLRGRIVMRCNQNPHRPAFSHQRNHQRRGKPPCSSNTGDAKVTCYASRTVDMSRSRLVPGYMRGTNGKPVRKFTSTSTRNAIPDVEFRAPRLRDVGRGIVMPEQGVKPRGRVASPMILPWPSGSKLVGPSPDRIRSTRD